MTTANRGTTRTAYISIALFLFLPFLVLAQTEVESNGLDVSEEIKLDQAELRPVPASTSLEPWFRTEQLSDNSPYGDFVVGPGRAEMEVRPGQTITFEISVTNRISAGRVFDITMEDMVGTADGSRAAVLLDGQRGPYSVRDYLKTAESSFVLDLGQRARIPVKVTVPLDAEPGGYYGSVLISTTRTAEGDFDAGQAQSPLIARIGTLFFVTVPGSIERAGQVEALSLPAQKWWYERGPIKLSLLYRNTGSVHLNPYGELRVTNLFGEEVGYVELEPWFVLPQSLRARDIAWDRELLFGRYTATALVNRGYDDVVDVVSVSFWVLPWKVIGGIFLVVFIIVFSLRTFFRQFEFKRRGK